MKNGDISNNESDDRRKIADLWDQAVTYENTRNAIGSIMKEEQNKSRRMTRWILIPIAASVLILIGLIGVFNLNIFTGNSGDSDDFSQGKPPASTKQDSIVSLIQGNKPAMKAAIDTVGVDKQVITLTLADDSMKIRADQQIRFVWKSSESVTRMTIKQVWPDSMALSIMVRQPDSTYLLRANALKPGWYRWGLTPGSKEKTFEITVTEQKKD